MNASSIVIHSVFFLSSVLLLSCSDNSTTSPVSEGSTFSATVAGSNNEFGVLQLTVGDALPRLRIFAHGSGDDLSLSGTLTIGSQVTDVSGEIHLDESEFSVAGGGFSFNGTYADGTISGSYTGPNGTGSFSGVDSTSGAATNYCGTFTGSANGIWSMTVSGEGQTSGVWFGVVGPDNFSETFTGAVSDGQISVSFDCDEVEGVDGTITGTFSDPNVTGTWQCGSESGTFEANSSGC